MLTLWFYDTFCQVLFQTASIRLCWLNALLKPAFGSCDIIELLHYLRRMGNWRLLTFSINHLLFIFLRRLSIVVYTAD